MVWLVLLVTLLPALGVVVFAGCHGGTMARLVAVQMASAVTSIMLIAMTFAFEQPAFIDVPLSLALLSLPGTLLMALFMERWL